MATPIKWPRPPFGCHNGELFHCCHLYQVAMKRLIHLFWLHFKEMMEENTVLDGS